MPFINMVFCLLLAEKCWWFLTSCAEAGKQLGGANVSSLKWTRVSHDWPDNRFTWLSLLKAEWQLHSSQLPGQRFRQCPWAKWLGTPTSISEALLATLLRLEIKWSAAFCKLMNPSKRHHACRSICIAKSSPSHRNAQKSSILGNLLWTCLKPTQTLLRGLDGQKDTLPWS